MSQFETYIGIDYSGRGTPLTRTAGLQVYKAASDRLPGKCVKRKSELWGGEPGRGGYLVGIVAENLAESPDRRRTWAVDEDHTPAGVTSGRAARVCQAPQGAAGFCASARTI